MGVALLSTFILAALLAPLIAPFDPTELHIPDRFSGPSARFFLGTDIFGRDILSRILFGLRNSLAIAISSVAVAVVLGGTLGVLAGYFSRLDTPVMRSMDILFAFPVLLLALVIVVVLGPGSFSTFLAIGIVYTPIFSRIARAPTLAVKEEPYIDAARALGASDQRILAHHILPNVASPIFVQAITQLGAAVIFESSLSFLGLGTQPPASSLGLMVSEGKNDLELSPWATVFPGAAIALLILSFNLVGDALQSVLDPRLQGRRG